MQNQVIAQYLRKVIPVNALILAALLVQSCTFSGAMAEKGPFPNVSSRVLAVLDALEAPRGQGPTPQWIGPLEGARVDEIGRLQVMISTTETTAQGRNELDARGCSIEIYDDAQNLVQAWVPVDRLKEVAALSFVKFLDLPNYGITNRP